MENFGKFQLLKLCDHRRGLAKVLAMLVCTIRLRQLDNDVIARIARRHVLLQHSANVCAAMRCLRLMKP